LIVEGFVGIGTSSPTVALDVAGQIRVGTTGTGGTAYACYNSTGILSTCATQPSSGGITGTGTANQVAFFNGTNSIQGDSYLYWDNTNKRLGIGVSSPQYALDTGGNINIGGSELYIAGQKRFSDLTQAGTTTFTP